MSGVEVKYVKADDDGIRIDRWFKRYYPDVSFGRLQKAMRKGDVRLDGKRVKGKEHVTKGQKVRVPPLNSLMGSSSPTSKKPGSRLSEEDITEVR